MRIRHYPFLICRSFYAYVKQVKNAFQNNPQFAGAIHLSATLKLFVKIVAVALLHKHCKKSFIKTLSKFIVKKQHKFSHATSKLTALLSAIKLSAKIIHRNINKAKLVNILSASSAKNVQSKVQQKLNLFANKKLKAALKARNIVASIASKKKNKIVVFKSCKHAKYVVLINPLNSSSNINVNVSVSTIFSIYRRVTPVGTPVTEENFLQPSNKQVAASYVVYSSSTMLVYTTKCGVHAFTYNPSLSVFCLCQKQMRFPKKSKTYSINKKNYIKFPNKVKKYIKFCQKKNKSTNRPYTSRYIGSLVANFHRNLLKGSIYLYPSTASHPNGKLRLLYKCNPIAFLAKQASSKASNSKKRILNIIPKTLHQRRSFFVSNNHIVKNVKRFIREFPDA